MFLYLLSGKIIIAFSLCLFYFPLWCLLRFFAEVVEQNKGIIMIEKIKYPIAAWTQFPDAIIQMFGDSFIQMSAIILKQLYIQADLLVLNTCILTGGGFFAQVLKKIPKL